MTAPVGEVDLDEALVEPGRWTVASLARALGRGVVEAPDLLDRALARIAAHDPALRAFAHLRADDARAEARRSAERRRRGEERSPLDGVPVAVKDLGDRVAGVPVTLGCRALEPVPAAAPSVLVERLRAAGCVVVGTTNVPELGHLATTDNDLRGTTSTPFAPGRCNAGGSSGGSAAAVAAGMVPAALGSDGAGSVRVPAALCGVVGLKPTFGALPAPTRPHGFRNGGLFVSPGPLTRTVEDARLLLGLLGGGHPTDPFSGSAGPHGNGAGAGPCRVGVLPDLGGFPVEAEVAAAVVRAGDMLGAAGHRVVPCELRLPASPDRLTAMIRRSVGWTLLDAVEGLAAQGLIHGPRHRAFPATLLALIAEARATSTDGWRTDGLVRTQLLDELERVLGQADVLLAPVTGVAEIANHPTGRTVGPDQVAGTPVDPVFGWCTTGLFNLTGHPALAAPVARTAAGTPLAVQIVGRRHADLATLAVAADLERAVGWADWYPDLLALPQSDNREEQTWL